MKFFRLGFVGLEILVLVALVAGLLKSWLQENGYEGLPSEDFIYTN